MAQHDYQQAGLHPPGATNLNYLGLADDHPYASSALPTLDLANLSIHELDAASFNHHHSLHPAAAEMPDALPRAGAWFGDSSDTLSDPASSPHDTNTSSDADRASSAMSQPFADSVLGGMVASARADAQIHMEHQSSTSQQSSLHNMHIANAMDTTLVDNHTQALDDLGNDPFGLDLSATITAAVDDFVPRGRSFTAPSTLLSSSTSISNSHLHDSLLGPEEQMQQLMTVLEMPMGGGQEASKVKSPRRGRGDSPKEAMPTLQRSSSASGKARRRGSSRRRKGSVRSASSASSLAKMRADDGESDEAILAAAESRRLQQRRGSLPSVMDGLSAQVPLGRMPSEAELTEYSSFLAQSVRAEDFDEEDDASTSTPGKYGKHRSASFTSGDTAATHPRRRPSLKAARERAAVQRWGFATNENGDVLDPEEKRVVMNILERARREDLKICFKRLHNVLPDTNDKSNAKGAILRRGREIIQHLQEEDQRLTNEVARLRRENEQLRGNLTRADAPQRMRTFSQRPPQARAFEHIPRQRTVSLDTARLNGTIEPSFSLADDIFATLNDGVGGNPGAGVFVGMDADLTL